MKPQKKQNKQFLIVLAFALLGIGSSSFVVPGSIISEPLRMPCYPVQMPGGENDSFYRCGPCVIIPNAKGAGPVDECEVQIM